MSRSLAGTFSSRDLRALRWGAVVVVAGLGWGLGLQPLLQARRATLDAAEAQGELLARERGLLVRTSDGPAATAEAAATSASLHARLFRAPDAITATAALALYVRGIADEQGVRLRQTETKNPIEGPNGIATLSVEILGETDVEGALGFLHSLEAGAPLLVVSRVSMEAAGAVGDQSNIVLRATVSALGAGNDAHAGGKVPSGPQIPVIGQAGASR